MGFKKTTVTESGRRQQYYTSADKAGEGEQEVYTVPPDQSGDTMREAVSRLQHPQQLFPKPTAPITVTARHVEELEAANSPDCTPSNSGEYGFDPSQRKKNEYYASSDKTGEDGQELYTIPPDQQGTDPAMRHANNLLLFPKPGTKIAVDARHATELAATETDHVPPSNSGEYGFETKSGAVQDKSSNKKPAPAVRPRKGWFKGNKKGHAENKSGSPLVSREFENNSPSYEEPVPLPRALEDRTYEEGLLEIHAPAQQGAEQGAYNGGRYDEFQTTPERPTGHRAVMDRQAPYDAFEDTPGRPPHPPMEDSYASARDTMAMAAPSGVGRSRAPLQHYYSEVHDTTAGAAAAYYADVISDEQRQARSKAPGRQGNHAAHGYRLFGDAGSAGEHGHARGYAYVDNTEGPRQRPPPPPRTTTETGVLPPTQVRASYAEPEDELVNVPPSGWYAQPQQGRRDGGHGASGYNRLVKTSTPAGDEVVTVAPPSVRRVGRSAQPPGSSGSAGLGGANPPTFDSNTYASGLPVNMGTALRTDASQANRGTEAYSDALALPYAVGPMALERKDARAPTTAVLPPTHDRGNSEVDVPPATSGTRAMQDRTRYANTGNAGAVETVTYAVGPPRALVPPVDQSGTNSDVVTGGGGRGFAIDGSVYAMPNKIPKSTSGSASSGAPGAASPSVVVESKSGKNFFGVPMMEESTSAPPEGDSVVVGSNSGKRFFDVPMDEAPRLQSEDTMDDDDVDGGNRLPLNGSNERGHTNQADQHYSFPLNPGGGGNVGTMTSIQTDRSIPLEHNPDYDQLPLPTALC